MQPYFLPYIGYWQLMEAVDVYVVLDNVNFIKGGYINRNFIWSKNAPQRININVQSISSNRRICDHYLLESQHWRDKLFETVRQRYSKARCYNSGMDLFLRILENEETRLSTFLLHQLKTVAAQLDISTRLVLASSIDYDNSLKGQDQVLAICDSLKASLYLNAIGGYKLYSSLEFSERGVDLRFIQMGDTSYRQFDSNFMPNLSILDAIMFLTKEELKPILQNYSIVLGNQ